MYRKIPDISFKALNKFPYRLKLILICVFLLASFFVVRGIYAYNFQNGTSWNFGAMGMYSSSDFPSWRYAKFYTKDSQGQKQYLNPHQFTYRLFLEYERYVSLPTTANKKKLKTAIENSFSYSNVEIELWRLRYNASTKTVRNEKFSEQ